MVTIKRLSPLNILIGTRRREIDRAIAAVIGASMKEHGQLQPIIVRQTPAAERPWTLVIGGHRTVGAEIEGIDELDAIVVKASANDAMMMEIAENLHRNDLSVLDRAFFVQGYREFWEEKYGKVGAGRPQNTVKLTAFSTEGASNFADAAADRLGLSKSSAERLGRIAANIHPELRRALQGTALADNQNRILQLVKMEPKKQQQLAFAFSEQPDLDKALALVEPAPKLPKLKVEQGAVLSRLVSAWEEASEETREQFLQHIGLADDAGLSGPMASIKREAA